LPSVRARRRRFKESSPASPPSSVSSSSLARSGASGSSLDEKQNPSRRQALDQTVEHVLRLGVDPVEILEHNEQRLDLTLAQEQLPQCIERAEPTHRPLQSSAA